MDISRVKLTIYIKPIFETSSNEASEWFGYYNYDTLNSDQSKMLCNRARFDGVAPEKGMGIELGYYDIPSGIWHHIATSDSWNWQQGAMLQWLPGAGNENMVIFNCTRHNHNVATIYDIETGESKNIDWAIYGITPDGCKSITLEMERSHWCRAYHYISVANPHWEGRIVEEDGIFEIDLQANTRKRIISIQDIIGSDYRPYFENCKHWLEHIMISPDGSKFCFLHRFSPIDNIFNYTTRLFIANIDGTNLQVLSGWEKFIWSHFGWDQYNRFSIYTYQRGKFDSSKGFMQIIKEQPCNIPNIFKALISSISSRCSYYISRFLDGRQSYYQFYTQNDFGVFELYGKFGNNIFHIDGHPSFTNDGNYMITDSYPDNEGMQHLIIYNIKTHKALTVARLYAAFKGNPASCDLHPKLSKDNNYIVVDTAYDGKHHMILFRLNWELIESKLS